MYVITGYIRVTFAHSEQSNALLSDILRAEVVERSPIKPTTYAYLSVGGRLVNKLRNMLKCQHEPTTQTDFDLLNKITKDFEKAIAVEKRSMTKLYKMGTYAFRVSYRLKESEISDIRAVPVLQCG